MDEIIPYSRPFTRCNCPNHRPCNHETGECACPPGRTGKRCEELCPTGRWGIDCERICHCSEQLGPGAICDPENGQCRCRDGWMVVDGRCAGRELLNLHRIITWHNWEGLE